MFRNKMASCNVFIGIVAGIVACLGAALAGCGSDTALPGLPSKGDPTGTGGGSTPMTGTSGGTKMSPTPGDGTGPSGGSSTGAGMSGGGKAGMPGDTSPPPAGAAACSMKDDGKQVCVQCTDASGRVVRDGCYPRSGMTTVIDCYSLRRVDGSLCNICFDPMGNIIKSVCADAPTMTPPPAPVTCKEEIEMQPGQICKVCYDQYGKELMRGCSAVPPDAGTGVSCDKTMSPDGTVCFVCTDASGMVLMKGCSSPATPPPSGGVQCKGTEVMGQMCIICTDETGKEVKRDCPGAPPSMPPPTPAIKCADEMRMDGSVCVTCYDETGMILKQACTAPPKP